MLAVALVNRYVWRSAFEAIFNFIAAATLHQYPLIKFSIIDIFEFIVRMHVYVCVIAIKSLTFTIGPIGAIHDYYYF